jgi:myosin-1
MSHLKENGDLPYKFIKQRDVLSGSVVGLLYGMKDADSALVKTTEANLLRKKLKYVVDVVDEWIAGGGLGCSTNGSQMSRWDGPYLEDGKNQDWVTVGRHGGDATRG